MSYVTVAVALGSVVAGGIGAASSASAGKKAQGAAAQAAQAYQKAGKQSSKLIGEAGDSAIDRLEPYREKLGNLTKLFADMFATNQRIIPEAFKQTRLTNTFNQNELDRLLERVLPGAHDAAQQAQQNNLSMLRGEIPADVTALIRRNAAQQSLQGGFGASESSRALEARDLGLTSLNLMEQGSNSAQRWIQTARTQMMAPLADPLQFLASPDLELKSILSAAGIAERQAGIQVDTAGLQAKILLGQANAATSVGLEGAEAKIKADQAAWQSIAQGIQGATGAFASYGYMQQPASQPVTGGYGGFSQAAQSAPSTRSIYGR